MVFPRDFLREKPCVFLVLSEKLLEKLLFNIFFPPNLHGGGGWWCSLPISLSPVLLNHLMSTIIWGLVLKNLLLFYYYYSSYKQFGLVAFQAPNHHQIPILKFIRIKINTYINFNSRPLSLLKNRKIEIRNCESLARTTDNAEHFLDASQLKVLNWLLNS